MLESYSDNDLHSEEVAVAIDNSGGLMPPMPPTISNLYSLSPSTKQSLKDIRDGNFRAGASMIHYSERVVEDILNKMFEERRGHYVESSSACDITKLEEAKVKTVPHVDKRLQYWRDMLNTRRQMQMRVQLKTGKSPEQVLFNRSSTLDNRNKETVRRLMDYADRLDVTKLSTKPVATLNEVQDPCTCNIINQVDETWPEAEKQGAIDVEIIGLPKIIQKELLGHKAAETKTTYGWMDSAVLDKRIDEKFGNICKVLEFFPDVDNLQVTGINVEKLRPKAETVLIEEQNLYSISTSAQTCSEEYVMESWTETDAVSPESEPELPDIALWVNGKDYILQDQSFNDCIDILTKFKCNPFQRRIKVVLKLRNIGKQTLSFTWSQGIYYYNRATLLLSKHHEFLFDTDNFRLAHGESYNLVVMYQPRKVNVAVELWRLNIDPRVFCGKQESLQLRFHGCCTTPVEYTARLREMHCMSICKANTWEMNRLVGHHAELAPLIEQRPMYCPYARDLHERELFNCLNPGYNCTRFDDLEVLKGMYLKLKKPRERQWDLRLDTIKMLIMRVENIPEREELFTALTIVLDTMKGFAPKLDDETLIDDQKQRTRFIYVRGVICNGLEEWEELMYVIEDSFFKPEMQRYYWSLIEQLEEENSEYQDPIDKSLPADFILEEKDYAAVMWNLHHSKYYRDTLYIQTYSHLCDVAETIASVIESTELVPT